MLPVMIAAYHCNHIFFITDSIVDHRAYDATAEGLGVVDPSFVVN